ncbi:MAG: GlxA family transcriptional regulator [Rhodoferax sp.]
MKIHLLLLPGALDASVGVSLSLFQTANTLLQAQGQALLFDVTVTGMRAGQETSGAGVPLLIAQPLQALPPADLLLLPGSYLASVQALDAWLALPQVQQAAHYLGAGGGGTGPGAVAASCVGTFVLAQAGLLRGRRATTAWWLGRDFRRRFPGVVLDMQRMVVQDGAITTAGAALAHGDLVMQLIAQYGGAQLAHTCARYLLMDQRTGQNSYALVQHLAVQDPQLRQVEHWVRKRLHEPVRIADMAQAVHLTPRTLARRFEQAMGLTPLQFVQRLRAEHALHLLRSTALPLQAVATQVGYADANALRRLLLREAGLSPSQVRRDRQLLQKQ